jgi:signal transduction histidine kinase
VKRIPQTSWFLIAKIDADEVYAPAREHVALTVVVTGLLLAGAVMTLLLVWSHQRSKLYREAQNGLERRVEQRTAELVAINEQLRQEMEMRIKAEKEYRSVTVRLAETEESERRRVARELHDRVGQSLTALNFSITAVMNRLPAGLPPDVMTRLEDSLNLVSDTMNCVRNVMADLRPPLLDDHGLAPVLHWYCREFSERSGIPAFVECEEKIPRLQPSEEIALFRIAQEALMNVMRHARATKVTVDLKATAETVRMSITDNGVGFVPENVSSARTESSGWGMLSMRERAELVGGSFQVYSVPGGGTRIVVEVKR